MTLNNAGDAVSPTPSQPLMGAGIGQASGLTTRDSMNPESDWPVPVGTGCQDSDRVAAPAPIPITKNAPASEPPQERESFSSIPSRREQTLLEFKKDFARARLQELRWMCANNPSERWAAKLEEAELWARGLGL